MFSFAKRSKSKDFGPRDDSVYLTKSYSYVYRPLHGVQGVECSNHSVPTNNPNDLATYGWLFHFWA